MKTSLDPISSIFLAVHEGILAFLAPFTDLHRPFITWHTVIGMGICHIKRIQTWNENFICICDMIVKIKVVHSPSKWLVWVKKCCQVWLDQKGLFNCCPGFIVDGDFCLPNEIDSWNFQHMLLFWFREASQNLSLFRQLFFHSFQGKMLKNCHNYTLVFQHFSFGLPLETMKKNV